MFSRIGSHRGSGCLWIVAQSCWEGCRADGSLEEWHRRIPRFRVKSWTGQHVYTSAKRKVTRERSKGKKTTYTRMLMLYVSPSSQMRTPISPELRNDGCISPGVNLALDRSLKAAMDPHHVLGGCVRGQGWRGDSSHEVRLMLESIQKIHLMFDRFELAWIASFSKISSTTS